MKLTIDLPDERTAALSAKAEARGVSQEEYARLVLEHELAGTATLFEQGLGLFGSPEDSVLLDEVVSIAYAERRRPTSPTETV